MKDPPLGRAEIGAGDYERIVFLPDLHVPFHDPSALSCAIGLIRIFRPHTIFILGDWHDFYQLSRFIKDPGRATELQEDFDTAHTLLKHVRKSAPSAKIYFKRGNHELRLMKALRSKAPEFSKMRGLDIRSDDCLGLNSLDIEYEEGPKCYRGILVKHGNIVRPKAAYAARGELERNMVTGISAHTHRTGYTAISVWGKTIDWMECGCLCDSTKLSIEYLEGQTADWQQAVGYGYLGSYHHEFSLMKISGGVGVYNGKEIIA